MYISVGLLNKTMGVDSEIARFFVDRKVPAGNSFWSKRLLYIARGNGYISIPVYYDLLYRLGLNKQLLLAEVHVLLMERIMHYAILAERKEMGREEQLLSIEKLLKGRIKNKTFYNELQSYMHQPILLQKGRLGRSLCSLNRADVFLYVLCDLPLEENQLTDAIRHWYSIHGTYLIMDDMADLKMDEEEGEENCIIELGADAGAFEKAMELIKKNSKGLKDINPALSDFFIAELEALERFRP